MDPSIAEEGEGVPGLLLAEGSKRPQMYHGSW